METLALWVLFVLAITGLATHLWFAAPTKETFIGMKITPYPIGYGEPFITVAGSMPGPSLMDMSTAALDAAPSTSEAKNYYKQLLLFTDQDIRKQGTVGLRLLADMRDRLYGPRDFRGNLTVDDFLANWPDWLPPMDTTMNEPPIPSDQAVMAEVKVLAFLQKNFPQEDMVDEQTGSLIRGIVEDFGYRYVFVKGEETVALRPDFLREPILKNWVNPTARA